MKQICILLLTVFFNLRSVAEENSYNFFYTGEKKSFDYKGPKDPRAKFNLSSGRQVFFDETYHENFFNREFGEEIFILNSFWFKEIKEKSICPNYDLFLNQDYIHYLFRLSSISYLFEMMKLNFKLSSEFGFNLKKCNLDYENVLSRCRPKTEDMRKFYQRAYGKFANDLAKINFEKLSKKDAEKKLFDLRKTNSLSINPTNYRIYNWCQKNKLQCRGISIDQVKSALEDFCQHDIERINLICSEEDSYYGLSSIEKMSELIKKSSAFNLVNQSGNGEECLRRFVKMNQERELYDDELTKTFPLVYSNLVEEKNRYKEGELFLPGALKEFDMKGLSDFLVALQPPKKEEIVIKVKAKVKEIPKTKREEKKEIRIEAPKPLVKIEEPKLPKISEFERVVSEINIKGLKSLSLNMDAFLSDYEFSKEKLDALGTNMKKFQTRKALIDMKAYDHLGGVDAPVGLIFLRYLLVTENHQGLYNVQSVIGDKFYVYNDVEKKEMPRLIELKNDLSTGNRWQIIVIKDP